MIKKDYRHYICISIIMIFLTLGLIVFSNSLWRIVESFRDFGLSVAYMWCELAEISHSITPTVTSLPGIAPWLDNTTSPLPSLPPMLDVKTFQTIWNNYWALFIDKVNFFSYLLLVIDTLYYVSLVLMYAIPLFVLCRLLFSAYLKKWNTDDDVDSNGLKIFKRLSDFTYRPIKKFLTDFYVFLQVHDGYFKTLIFLCAVFFNGITVFVEFMAYYMYLVSSFDFISIFGQIQKLFMDLSALFTHTPTWVLLLIGVVVWEYISRSIAYQRLYHRERCNYGFLNERGVVTIVWGEMGTGKTTLITDMALSAEKKLRDQAFEVILECDMKFPYFAWASFQKQLRQAIYFHVIYDVWSCRRWINRQRRLWEISYSRQYLFGYDYERYGLFYDDRLSEVYIWDILKDYAQAYLIYTVQSSLIISNYSIRVDGLFYDMENFPVWNMDFFKRDSRLLDSFSRNAHILDFDMLRMGKIMLENNPNRNAFGFGVYVITEIDKERKNTPQLKEIEKNSEECNQKNDLFELLIMMGRHACVIANRVFVVVLADLQRPDNLGAVSRELGEMSYIEGKDKKRVLLPFFSPFYLIETLGKMITAPFVDIYTEYSVHRSDNTLPLYLYKGITAKFEHYRERTENTFGSSTLHLEMQSGRMDGRVKTKKWYRMDKKIYSKRFGTDCQNAIFEARGEINRMGIDDLREYVTYIASQEELRYQNSHMQVELAKCAA